MAKLKAVTFYANASDWEALKRIATARSKQAKLDGAPRVSVAQIAREVIAWHLATRAGR